MRRHSQKEIDPLPLVLIHKGFKKSRFAAVSSFSVSAYPKRSEKENNIRTSEDQKLRILSLQLSLL